MTTQTEDRSGTHDATCQKCGQGIDYIGGEYWGSSPGGREECTAGGEHEPRLPAHVVTCSFCSVCGRELTSDASLCSECRKGNAEEAAVNFILGRS